MVVWGGTAGGGQAKVQRVLFLLFFAPSPWPLVRGWRNQGQLVASPATPSPGVGVPGVGLTFAGAQWPRGGGGGAEEQRGGPGGQRPASCCKRKKRADCANEAD